MAAAQPGEKLAQAWEEAGAPPSPPLPGFSWPASLGFFFDFLHDAVCILAGAGSAAPLAGCWICLVPAALLFKNGCMLQLVWGPFTLLCDRHKLGRVTNRALKPLLLYSPGPHSYGWKREEQ